MFGCTAMSIAKATIDFLIPYVASLVSENRSMRYEMFCLTRCREARYSWCGSVPSAKYHHSMWNSHKFRVPQHIFTNFD